jgi:hypothetical protein
MANDRYCFLVIEESLPEGTIAELRKSRARKAERPLPAKQRRLPADQAIIQTSARSRQST